jgi:carbon storage regulator CsrA
VRPVAALSQSRHPDLAQPLLFSFLVLARCVIFDKQSWNTEWTRITNLISATYGETEIAMLVLTRKLDEAIRIGDDIKITVIRVKGNTVRLGIEAPRSVRVVRDELDKHTEAPAMTSRATPTVAVGSVSVLASSTAPAATVPTLTAAAPTAEFHLGGLGQMQSEDDGAVITTVVDSPQPSGTRLFVGKVKLGRPAAPLVQQEVGDQAAPLRAFLRGGRKLQAAG